MMTERLAQEVPPGLLQALERRAARLHYTACRSLYSLMWLWGDSCCGVFGDGDNGAYEWFIWDNARKTVETSDCGYGSPHVALRDGLNRADPPELLEACKYALRALTQDTSIDGAQVVAMLALAIQKAEGRS